jgi:hypothetical protein
VQKKPLSLDLKKAKSNDISLFYFTQNLTKKSTWKTKKLSAYVGIVDYLCIDQRNLPLIAFGQ